MRPAGTNLRQLYTGGALMAASLGLSFCLSLQPERLDDLHSIVGWSGEWLRGVHVYGPGRLPDYPPWGTVLVSPLALLPEAFLAPVWATVNILLLAILGVVLARRLGTGATTTATLTCLLVAAGASRTLNQFSLAVFTFGAVGFFGPTRWRGVWLGLSLIKPQIAGVFILAALVERRWKDLAVACAVPAVLTAVYAAVAHVGVGQSLADFWVSAREHRAVLPLGRSEVTLWLVALIPRLDAIVAAAIIGAVAAAPLASRRLRVTSNGRFWLAAALISLLSFRHLSYNFVMLLPWVATLEGAALWIAAGLLVADPSAVASMVAPGSWIEAHADRVVLVGLWMALLRAAIQTRRQPLR